MKKKNKFTAVFVAFALAFSLTALTACGNSSLQLETYAAAIDFHTADQLSFVQGDYAAIVAYADGTSEKSRPEGILLRWSDSSDCTEYTVTVSEYADYSDALTYVVNDREVEVYNLKVATEYHWKVSSSDGVAEGVFTTSDVCPRNLYVDGVTNVRDMGGYMTSYGRRIRQGLLYRGARLNKSDVNDDGYATAPETFVPEITEKGIDVFENQLKIKSEIDLRLLNRNGYPADKAAESAVPGVENYIRIPMNGLSAIDDNAKMIKQFMEYIADESHYPVYYHCNIGTDRTGMMAYLIGALCGMSEDDLMKDYLFSNFGNIGEAKTPDNSKNKYIRQLAAGGDFAGDTLRERVENYFLSIGVSAETYTSVRNILLGV